MNDLATWLRAQLDLDEAHARKDLAFCAAASPRPWRAHCGYNLPFSILKSGDDEVGRFIGSYGRRLADGEDDRHVADVMLAARLTSGAFAGANRVLAEVDAKRRILDLNAAIPGDGINFTMAEQDRAEETIRLLGLPYADRPGYREEWRP